MRSLVREGCGHDTNTPTYTCRVAVEKAEESSEDVSSSFTMGDISADVFVKEYLPLREQYHRRNAGFEKAGAQLQA